MLAMATHWISMHMLILTPLVEEACAAAGDGVFYNSKVDSNVCEFVLQHGAAGFADPFQDEPTSEVEARALF